MPNATRYTFVSGGVRFVVLDASHKADGTDYDHGNFEWSDSNVDAPQIEWLAKTLAASREPVIVFVHQQLDGTGAYYVKNAPQVREALEKSGKVIAVLQGHRHEGGFSTINGIPYFTFRGLIEGAGPWNSAYSIVDVMPDLERASPRLPPGRVAQLPGLRCRSPLACRLSPLAHPLSPNPYPLIPHHRPITPRVGAADAQGGLRIDDDALGAAEEQVEVAIGLDAVPHLRQRARRGWRHPALN